MEPYELHGPLAIDQTGMADLNGCLAARRIAALSDKRPHRGVTGALGKRLEADWMRTTPVAPAGLRVVHRWTESVGPLKLDGRGDDISTHD